MKDQIPLRSWHLLSGREQAVWGAAYATASEPGVTAALQADRIVASLASVRWPETEAPEHRAARLCGWLTFEQFRGWYIVELMLHRPGEPPVEVTEAQLQEAFKAYLMSTNDFLRTRPCERRDSWLAPAA